MNCESYVRAWLFDPTGRLMGLVPSQYYDHAGAFTFGTDDFGVGEENNPAYAGTFGKLIPASGAVYDSGAPDLAGEIIKTDLGGGLVEWGIWRDGTYTTLGWVSAEGLAVPEDGPLTLAQFETLVGGDIPAHQPSGETVLPAVQNDAPEGVTGWAVLE